MLNTLRGRMILSHVLPLLVTVPLMGLALVYVLETQVLLPSLSRELTGQAILLATMAGDSPQMLNDPVQGQRFLERVDPLVPSRLMLLNPEGFLIASTDPSDTARLGQRLELPDLPLALSGLAVASTRYNTQLDAEVADVLVPVQDSSGQIIGVIRLTQSLTTVLEQFLRLRSLIAVVLGVGLLLGAAAGWILALTLSRPLDQVRDTVDRLAQGEAPEPLPEWGPEEVRRMLYAVNSFAERIRTLEVARRQLLSNLVHELGRPLGALRSAIQALQGGAATDPALHHDLLAGMDAEIGQLRRLLDDLSQLYNQEIGRLELARRPADMGTWLAGLLATHRQSALEKGLRWEVSIPGDLPTVNMDPDRLGQAMGNLLSNAIKYTPAGGLISVSAGVRDRELWIRISDTGPGIAPEEQALVFAPFYRSNRDRRFPQGMGLGLTIARDLVVAHGGRLELESVPGSGTTFTLWLPLEPVPLHHAQS